MPVTCFPAVLVDQTTLPSASCRTKSPASLRLSFAPSLTGCSRLADQTTCGKPIAGWTMPDPLLVWTMKTAKR
ncbi:hypothetical protein HanRHA438_Chr13g0578341 [Helianthus annuus]|nr:hypothetical protein HanRHA438_Chr13g0578341 [Helianthus annuus]